MSVSTATHFYPTDESPLDVKAEWLRHGGPALRITHEVATVLIATGSRADAVRLADAAAELVAMYDPEEVTS